MLGDPSKSSQYSTHAPSQGMKNAPTTLDFLIRDEDGLHAYDGYDDYQDGGDYSWLPPDAERVSVTGATFDDALRTAFNMLARDYQERMEARQAALEALTDDALLHLFQDGSKSQIFSAIKEVERRCQHRRMDHGLNLILAFKEMYGVDYADFVESKTKT